MHEIFGFHPISGTWPKMSEILWDLRFVIPGSKMGLWPFYDIFVKTMSQTPSNTWGIQKAIEIHSGQNASPLLPFSELGFKNRAASIWQYIYFREFFQQKYYKNIESSWLKSRK